MKKLSYIFLITLSFLTLSACTTKKETSSPIAPVVNNQVATTTTSTGSSYSLSDIATHKVSSDCWSIIDESVYDLTAYIESAQHPGGDNVSDCCGIDCSKVFNAIGKHSSNLTDNVLKQYYLGAEVK